MWVQYTVQYSDSTKAALATETAGTQIKNPGYTMSHQPRDALALYPWYRSASWCLARWRLRKRRSASPRLRAHVTRDGLCFFTSTTVYQFYSRKRLSQVWKWSNRKLVRRLILIFGIDVLTACHWLNSQRQSRCPCHVARWPRSVRKHLFTEAMDADQLFVDIWAGHRVDRKQFLTRRQALVVNVLRVEFDLNLFVQSVQVQLQTVQRVPAINTQYILPCKQLDGGTRQSANSRCWQLGHLQYVFALCDLDLWHFDLILNG